MTYEVESIMQFVFYCERKKKAANCGFRKIIIGVLLFANYRNNRLIVFYFAEFNLSVG